MLASTSNATTAALGFASFAGLATYAMRRRRAAIASSPQTGHQAQPAAAVPDIEQNEYYKGKRRIARFEDDLDDLSSVQQYYRNHAIRMMAAGVRWSGVVEPLYDDDGEARPWGGATTWQLPAPSADGECREGHSVFVFTWARRKGRMKKWLARHPHALMVTAESCGLSAYFARRRRAHVVYEVPAAVQPAYGLAARFYGDRVTDRTGVHMINHIDEGLWVLGEIGASEDARRAYAIHPLVQGDADLAAFFARPELVSAVRPRVLALALEYRNIANAHLSWHPAGVDAFSLSPLPEVNDMLVADKVQNRKDFELFHADTHPRRERLAEYFYEWMQKLGGSPALCPHFACTDPEARFVMLRDKLIAQTGGRALALAARRPKPGCGDRAVIKKEDQPGYAQAHGITRYHSK